MSVNKLAIGYYRISEGNDSVIVDHFTKKEGASFNGWVARAEWDNYLVTDPLNTYKEAKEEAIKMLNRKIFGENF